MSQRRARTPARRPLAAVNAGALALAATVAAGPAGAITVDVVDTWASTGYAAYASTCPQAESPPGEDKACKPPALPAEWTPKTGPIFTYGTYENVLNPTRNRYYDQKVSYSYQINAVSLSSSVPVGTGTSGPNANAVGQPAGEGISGAWELSTSAGPGATATLLGASVKIRSTNPLNPDRLIDWGTRAGQPTVAYNLLPGAAAGAVWINRAEKETAKTPFDVSFLADRALTAAQRVILAADDGTVRIQVYQSDAVSPYEFPSAVLGDVTVKLNVTMADLSADSTPIYARANWVQQYDQNQKVNITNALDEGFIASGVQAGAPNDPSKGFTITSTPPGPVDLAPGESTDDYSASPRYSFRATSYGTVTDTVTVAGDARFVVKKSDDVTLDKEKTTDQFVLTGVGVGPMAQVSGYGGDLNNGQAYEPPPASLDGLDTVLAQKEGNKFYRELTFANIFGESAGEVVPPDANLTLLTLGLNAANTGLGIELFELIDGNWAKVTGQATGIAAKDNRLFRVYLDPTLATHCGAGSAYEYCSGLLLTTDVLRGLRVTTLAEGSTVFKFDLFAQENGPVPVPATLSLLGLGLAGLGFRRSRGY